MAFVMAAAAALANAFTSILQRMGVEDAPSDAALRPGLLAHAVRRPVWLAGTALLVVGAACQAVALHFGELSSVEPVLTAELLFLVAILAVWFRFRVRAIEWLAAFAAAAGLAGFLYFAQPGADRSVPATAAWTQAAVGCGAVVALAVLLARTGPRWWRAAMFGSAAAVGYAFTAALIKVVTGFVAGDWISMARHWETYGIIVAGLASVFLAQNAFHAGPIAASQATLVLLEPLASILLGVTLFNDSLRTEMPWGALEGASLLVLFVSAAYLCQSPLIGGAKAENAAYQEMLTPEGRAQWRAEHRGRDVDDDRHHEGPSAHGLGKPLEA